MTRHAGVTLTCLALVACSLASVDGLVAPARSGRADLAWGGRRPAAPAGETDFEYVIEWAIQVEHVATVGLTAVQDTLLWVSSGGRSGSQDPNWILIYDLRTRTLVDSFPQFVTTTWGYVDMTYDSVEDVVYAGTEAYRLDKIDATTRSLAATYSISGNPRPSEVMALTFDGDSLYCAHFTNVAVCKFSKTGTGSRQVAPKPPYAVIGLAYDGTRNRFWATTADYSGRLLEYDGGSWALLDSHYLPEFDLFGGAEMWGDDRLLVVRQGTVDQVFCIRLPGAGINRDVGVSAILSPAGSMHPGAVTPRARIRNYGKEAQSEVPVHIAISKAGTPLYASSLTLPGPLQPWAEAEVDFAPQWDATEGSFDVTAWTLLGGDEAPSNDTAGGAVLVTNAAWEVLPEPPSMPDRIVHATVYDPGTDQVFQVGGNPAGQSGSYDGLCRAYNPESGVWSNKATMPTPVGWAGYGLVKGKLYLLGGHDNSGGVALATQVYDIEADTWSTGRAFAGFVAPVSATWRDSLIYLMGGVMSSGDISRRAYIYDPGRDTWWTATSLPRAAFMGTAAIIGDTIYMAQAQDSSDRWPNLYKGAINPTYPMQVTWTRGPALPEPSFNGATVAAGRDVFWIGGFSKVDSAIGSIWHYSQATGVVTRFVTDYPTRVARVTFAASRPTASGWEIYGMAGDQDGNWAPPNRTYVRLALGDVGVEESSVEQPTTFCRVAPSVARNCAVVSYSLGQGGPAELTVYDATGSLVRVVARGPVPAGTHRATWDLTDELGWRVPGGAYFFRLAAPGQTHSAKVVVSTRR